MTLQFLMKNITNKRGLGNFVKKNNYSSSSKEIYTCIRNQSNANISHQATLRNIDTKR